MIPDALKSAICPDGCHTTESYWVDGGPVAEECEWEPREDCPTCGGSGINPKMIVRGWWSVIPLDPDSRYVVIPLEDT